MYSKETRTQKKIMYNVYYSLNKNSTIVQSKHSMIDSMCYVYNNITTNVVLHCHYNL